MVFRGRRFPLSLYSHMSGVLGFLYVFGGHLCTRVVCVCVCVCVHARMRAPGPGHPGPGGDSPGHRSLEPFSCQRSPHSFPLPPRPSIVAPTAHPLSLAPGQVRAGLLCLWFQLWPPAQPQGPREEARNKAGQGPEWGCRAQTWQSWGSEHGGRGPGLGGGVQSVFLSSPYSSSLFLLSDPMWGREEHHALKPGGAQGSYLTQLRSHNAASGPGSGE